MGEAEYDNYTFAGMDCETHHLPNGDVWFSEGQEEYTATLEELPLSAARRSRRARSDPS